MPQQGPGTESNRDIFRPELNHEHMTNHSTNVPHFQNRFYDKAKGLKPQVHVDGLLTFLMQVNIASVSLGLMADPFIDEHGSILNA